MYWTLTKTKQCWFAVFLQTRKWYLVFRVKSFTLVNVESTDNKKNRLQLLHTLIGRHSKNKWEEVEGTGKWGTDKREKAEKREKKTECVFLV